MKALKLLSLFIVIAGGIFLALNWGTLFPGEHNEEDGSFGDEDLIDVGQKCAEIRNAWASQKGWNEDLYMSQREDIDQSKAMRLFSRSGYNTVNNCLRENSTNKACEAYTAKLKANSFSDTALRTAYAGVQAIKGYEQLSDDGRIKRVEQIQALYTNVSSFVRSSHAITPRFKPEEDDWVSFASSQNSILSRAKGYRNNSLFAEMKAVPGFADGLSEEGLKAKTNPQRRSFYEGLSEQITNYFSSEEPTDDNVKRLDKIYNKFADQETNYGIESLARFKVRYGKKEE